MVLTNEQLLSLLNIIKRNSLFYIGTTLGEKFFTSEDKAFLAKKSIDYKSLYSISDDVVFNAYHWGLLTDVLKEQEAKKYKWKDLKKYVQKGKYIPMTQKDQIVIDSIKNEFLDAIKNSNNRIYNDITLVARRYNDSVKNEQLENIEKKIKQGEINKKTRVQIAQEIGRQTQDWSRNFGRIVETVSHRAFSNGRIALFEKSGGPNQKVYIQVYPGACKHCIRLYLTKGIGSKSKVFTIEELRANGTNIGRKVNDWLPVIPPSHPFCRCHPVKLEEGMVWDEKSKLFVYPDKYKPKIDRQLVTISFAGKEYQV